MVPLTVRQIHSMQKLQILAPELKAIQQKYKNDKQRQQQEIMAFYRENKVNPAASCLPVLLQIPIFISLFFVLRDFEDEVFPQYPGSDLGFLGIVPNITDKLTEHWSGYLLLVLYVASQVASTLLTPITDKTQRALFLALPFLFIFFVINFPVGLMLYWITTNLWTVGQGLVTRRLMPRPADAAAETHVPNARTRGGDATGAPSRGEGSGVRRGADEARAPAQAARAPDAAMSVSEGAGRDTVQVETTGETVGEAKWAALRELEALVPGLDKGRVRFQVVSEGERGLLGVGQVPARVMAEADRAPPTPRPRSPRRRRSRARPRRPSAGSSSSSAPPSASARASPSGRTTTASSSRASPAPTSGS